MLHMNSSHEHGNPSLRTEVVTLLPPLVPLQISHNLSGLYSDLLLEYINRGSWDDSFLDYVNNLVCYGNQTGAFQ